MDIIDDWKNGLCLEDDIPVIDNLITLLSIYNYCLEGENIINREATIRWKGYDPNKLSTGSDKKVWATCSSCGKGRWVRLSRSESLCNSCAKTGEKHPMYGMHHTNDAKKKIAAANTGDKNFFYGMKICGENHHAWRGGHKLKIARRHAKRKALFGFIPLNKPHDGFDGHHLDFNYVLFVPKELNRSVSHSVSRDRNMDVINDKVCDWYLEFQGVSS